MNDEDDIGTEKRRKLESTGNTMDIDVKDGFEIAGIVKSKILFDRYPKSIMR